MNNQTQQTSPELSVDTLPGYENLWAITAGQRIRYLAAIGAMVFTNLCMFGAPLIAGRAIDVVTSGDLTLIPAAILGSEPEVTHFLWLAAAGCILITAIGGVSMFLRGMWAARASEQIARNLREALYRRLHHLHSSFFDTADTGDLVQRCSSDVETLRVFLVSDVIEIGRAILLVACVAPILFHIHADLALWSFVLMPFLAAGAYIFFRKVRQVFEVTDVAEGAMTANLQENLTGIRVVRAFARADYEVEKFAQNNKTFRDHNHRLVQLMGYYWSVSDFFSMLQIGLVLFMGARYTLAGELSIGDLFVFMTCVSIVIWPVRQLGRVLTDTGKATISLERVNHILQAAPETPGFTPATGRAQGSIEAQGLTFGYDPARPVLKELSISIRPGETIGIVGPPGSGKSTFMRALLRLYPYQQGSLLVDGHEVSDLDRSWLRAQIGVVLQDPFLYSRSIRDNLLLARQQASADEMHEACREAALDRAIERFPQGYDELVGERGVTLSGGQRQRTALARALLKNPPILVLDDSLSAVDTGTEQHILQALAARRGRQTTLVIAHRLSSVVNADRIMVMEQGRCVQLGHHTELIAVAGPYRNMCERQGALDRSIAADMRKAETPGGSKDVR